jgi:hypothetical protein
MPDYLLFDIEQLSDAPSLACGLKNVGCRSAFINHWADQIDSLTVCSKYTVIFLSRCMNTQPWSPSHRPHFLSQHMSVLNG